MALAKNEASELKECVYLRQKNYIETQRILFGNIRHMEEKRKDGSTFKVTTNDNGVTVEHTDKIEIEKIIAQNNEAIHHQVEGGS